MPAEHSHLFEIRRLQVTDVEDYRTIRLAALQDAPEAFGSTYEIEAARPLAAFEERLTASTVFGAYVDRHIVGMAGFKQESGQKDCHKGFLWGLYVQSASRGQGISATLVEAVLEHAANVVEQLRLAVVQDNEAAIRLYRKYAFEPYGVEPRALKTQQGYADEVLMVRFLRTERP